MDLPWLWFRKLALGLFFAALLTGLGATALYLGRRIPVESWAVLFVLAIIVLTITSTILNPGVLLPNIRNPHPEFLSDDLDDEWDELRARRFSRPHLLMGGGVIAALAYLWFLFYYGKVTNAIWFGWLPVGVPAIGLALLLVAFARHTDWYLNRRYRTPTWVIFVAFAGFMTSQFLGVYMTEQVVAPGAQRLAIPGTANDYTYLGTRGYYLWREFSPSGGGSPDVDVPDCDGDSCGYVILAILVVVLTLILVLGAAFIPHMWVLSCLVLLALIALLALHEVRRDRSVDEWPDRSGRPPRPGR